MDDFPVPLRFELPRRWRGVARDFGGIRDALAVAVRDDAPGGYTPVLTLSGGWRVDGSTLEQIADESLARLRAETGHAVLLHRREAGGQGAPGLSQVVRSDAVVGGHRLVLVRQQALLALLDVHDPRRRAVLVVSCTGLAGQARLLAPELAALVGGLRVDEPRGR